jgi:MFS transporter, ACS family, glucarate transporter
MSIETPAAPTRARYVVVLWLCGLATILYLDRICISQAATRISEDLKLTKSDFSYAMMAFTAAYGLFAVPAGRLGDKYGPRLVLALIVAAWSGFTAATGLVHGLAGLIVVRFFFGAAEAGAFPNAARIIARWFPMSERGRVQGIMLSFAQIGGIAAPIVTALIIQALDWRWTFLSYAVLGFLWTAGYWVWFRDDPANHPRVNELEVNEIREQTPPPPLDPGPVPWRKVFINRGIIVLALLQIFGSFFTYFFYTWFPTYLEEARGIGNVAAGNLNSLAIGGSAIGMLFGGWMADRITRLARNPVRARRYACMAGFLVAAACMSIGTRCESALNTALFWSAAMAAMHIQLPNWWSMIIPQSGRHTATIFGLTNGLGVLGAMSSQRFVAWFAEFHERRGLTGRAAWDPMFDVYTLVLIAGAIAWWLYKFTPLEERPGEPQSGEKA